MKPGNAFTLISLLLFCALNSCGLGSNKGHKKIFYINSYHEGYPSSDDITKGILETIKEENITLIYWTPYTRISA